MQKILIYGDSNVWGDNFLTGVRIPDEQQWPNILQRKLQGKYQIFQEGLPGRLAGNEEREKTYKNGKDNFLATFRTVAPVNQIVIMLGTNDLQIKYNKSSKKIIEDLIWYYKIIQEEYMDVDNQKKFFVNNTMPKFLFILPANFDYQEQAKCIFDLDSERKRLQVIEYFKTQFSNNQYLILEDMPLFADGIHLNEKGHEKLASLVERKLQQHGE